MVELKEVEAKRAFVGDVIVVQEGVELKLYRRRSSPSGLLRRVVRGHRAKQLSRPRMMMISGNTHAAL